jgi:hypothetical protein
LSEKNGKKENKRERKKGEKNIFVSASSSLRGKTNSPFVLGVRITKRLLISLSPNLHNLEGTISILLILKKIMSTFV